MLQGCVVPSSREIATAAARHTAAVAAVLFSMTSPQAAADTAKVSGVLTANGAAVELPYVYAWPEKEGFYDAGDPTWNVLFVSRELGAREIGDPSGTRRGSISASPRRPSSQTGRPCRSTCSR